ncbi:MAG: methyltransferase domain-containing protein [Chloroflexi bacterium]|nr:methyltransferase domain-containing protein [Chloroflexota bacterium]
MNTGTLPPNIDPQELRAAVRGRYSAVASAPDGPYSFRVGRAFAEALGYPPALLEAMPPGATDAFTGVATPVLQADLRPGEAVLDLGCGGGLDLIIAAEAVGQTGRAIGIDMAEPMVARAGANLRALRLEQAEAVVGVAETLPLPDAAVDCVVANGILNLAPDKSAVLAEVARVLHRGGRFILAETTLRHELPPGEVQGLEDWFR